MKPLRNVLIALLVAGGIAYAAAPQKFHVGVGRPTGKILRGATATGGTLTVTRAATTLAADGSLQVTLVYLDSSNNTVHTRVLFVAADGSKVTDTFGNIIAQPVPSTITTNCGACASALDTAIANGASSGKLNL